MWWLLARVDVLAILPCGTGVVLELGSGKAKRSCDSGTFDVLQGEVGGCGSLMWEAAL
jgi:hypothetical protein